MQDATAANRGPPRPMETARPGTPDTSACAVAWSSPPSQDAIPSAQDTLRAAMAQLSEDEAAAAKDERIGAAPMGLAEETDLQLQELRERTRSIEHNSALWVALQQNESFVLHPQTLRIFLRASRNDIDGAVDHLTRYFEAKRELWGDAKLTKRISLDDFTKEDKSFLAKSRTQMLPTRDRAGRAVLFSYERERARSPQRNGPATLEARFLWYLIMSYIEGHDDVQNHGLVLVQYGLDLKPEGSHAKRDARWAMCKVVNAMPIRIAGVHLCYGEGESHPAANVVALGLAPAVRCRIQLVRGDHDAYLHHLEEHGAPINVLPLDEGRAQALGQGGQTETKHAPKVLNTRELSKLLRRRRKIESNPEENSGLVELLKQSDVIIGNTRFDQRHPANIGLFHVVRERWAKFYAERSGKQQVNIAREVVQQLRDEGIRFVKQVGRDGLWGPADESLIVAKITKLHNRPRTSEIPNALINVAADGVTSVATSTPTQAAVGDGAGAAPNTAATTAPDSAIVMGTQPALASAAERSAPSAGTSERLALTDKDIICGSCIDFANHPGNQHFDSVVQSFHPFFAMATEDNQDSFVKKVKAALREQGRRFLEAIEDSDGNCVWIEVSEDDSIDEIRQAFEGLCQ